MTPHGALRAVPAHAPRPRTFCGYCGRPPREDTQSPSRVCGDCGMGLLLTADEALAPAPADAFLVVDAGLNVRALSRAAERLFAVAETDVVDQSLSEILAPADASDEARATFQAVVAAAARAPLAAVEPEVQIVRPARAFGVRYRARIGPCTPGHAALAVLSPL